MALSIGLPGPDLETSFDELLSTLLTCEVTFWLLFRNLVFMWIETVSIVAEKFPFLSVFFFINRFSILFESRFADSDVFLIQLKSQPFGDEDSSIFRIFNEFANEKLSNI